MALNATQIDTLANLIVGSLREAATIPGNVLDGTVAASVLTVDMRDALTGTGVWAIRHSMDAIAATVAEKLGLGVGPGELDWDVHGPALGKSYLFNAPLSALTTRDKSKAQPDEIHDELSVLHREAEDAKRREQTLRDMLSILYRRAVQVPNSPDTFVIVVTRAEWLDTFGADSI